MEKCKIYLIFVCVFFCYATTLGQVHSPEYTSFEPNTSNNVVNLVTGDFTHNIPLLEVPNILGGFPINLFYNAGITNEQQSSWTGLGWNINVGSIERNVNGYPDDYKNASCKSSTKTQEQAWNHSASNTSVATDKFYWNIGKGKGFSSGTPFNIKPSASDAMNNTFQKNSIFGDVFYIYGPLYFKDSKSTITAWGTQDKDKIMDIYSNPYNSSTYNSGYLNDASNCLSFPNYDDYIVTGNGILGNMSPKILEFGSLNGRGYISDRWDDDEHSPKKEFYYNNRFDFTKNSNSIYFYFNNENTGFFKVNSGVFSSPNVGGDPIWDNNYSGGGINLINSEGKSYYNATTQRKGGGKFVQWYTNSQMQVNQANLASNGIMEYEKLLGQRGNSDLFDESGIGGYSITDENGITYHYALPVYNFSEYKVNESISDPGNDFYETANSSKYATSWLLTAITGVDFVDRGIIGVVDDADLGYWVKFDYGKWTDGYMWQTPYTGYETVSSGRGSYAYGRKQIYYLNYIKTKTHTAYFIKELREDNLGKDQFRTSDRTKYYYPFSFNGANLIYAYGTYTSFDIPEKQKLLRLKKIILVKNEDIQINSNAGSALAVTQTGHEYSWFETALAGTGNIVWGTPTLNGTSTFQINYNDNVIDVNDIIGLENSINSKAIKIINFDYDYSLCLGTPNTTNSSNIGKLTLKSVRIADGGNIDIQPKYNFDYYNSTTYNHNYKDDWGYYVGPSADNPSLSNKDLIAKPDINSWSLKEIISPLGGKMRISYDPDTYYKETFNNIVLSGIGGGLRVSKIEMIDENNMSSVTEYDYTDPYTNLTSGITSMAPIHGDRYIPYVYEMPGSQVMYKFVTVKNLSNSNQINSKVVYEFNVLESNASQSGLDYTLGNYLKISDVQLPVEIAQKVTGSYWYHVVARSSLIEDCKSFLGVPKSIKNFDKDGNILSETKYEYYKPGEVKGGIIQETFCTSKQQIIWDNDAQTSNSNLHFFTSVSRTSYPCILKSVTTLQKGVSNVTYNKDYDFFSGKCINTQNENSFGEKIKISSLSAYDKYGGIQNSLGSKVYNINNSNMLNAEAGSRLYSIDQNGIERLLKANVQTFGADWNYYEFNGSKYELITPSNTTFYNTLNPYKPIFREAQNYSWVSLNDTDGSTLNFTEYSWGGASQQNGWKTNSDVKLYNHNSQVLEITDVNGTNVSSKFGYSNKYQIASINNAKYTSFAYSGAEDLADGNYFGGEVSGSNKRYFSKSISHTGNYCVRLNPGEFGFAYTGTVGTSTTFDFKKGQKVRASVWVHKLNKEGARLCYDLLNGTTSVGYAEVQYNSISSKQIGNYYLLTLDFTIPAGTTANSLDIKVKYPSGAGSLPIYVDDFRVHPQEATMTSTVYDEKTGWVTATLDENNFGSKFYYDNAGRLLRVDKETSQGWKKVSESSYHYGRP